MIVTHAANAISELARDIFRSIYLGLCRYPIDFIIFMLSMIITTHYSFQLSEHAGIAYDSVLLLLFAVLATRIVLFGLSIRDIDRISAIVAFEHLGFALLGPWQFIDSYEFGAFASNEDEVSTALTVHGIPLVMGTVLAKAKEQAGPSDG